MVSATHTAYGPPPPISQPTPLPYNEEITPQLVLRTLVAAGGHPDLAAERLGLLRTEDLLAAVALDPASREEMAQIVRMFALVHAMSAMQDLGAHLIDALPDMDAGLLVKAHAGMLAMVELLSKNIAAPTANNTNNNTNNTTNMVNVMMAALPPKVREAFRVMQLPAADSLDTALDAADVLTDAGTDTVQTQTQT